MYFLLSFPVYTESHLRLSDPRVSGLDSSLFSFTYFNSFTPSNPFSLTFLADPHLLTPIESHFYKKHRGVPSLEFTPRKSTPVTSLESPLVDVFIRIDLKSFRINTYEKHRGEGGVIVNQESDEDSCHERAQRVEGSLFPNPSNVQTCERSTAHARTHSRLALLSLKGQLTRY